MKLLEDLYIAYYCVRRHKRNTDEQLRFELNLENNLLSLYHQLKERIYKIEAYSVFIINKSVKREIFAAGFSDRVIHHLSYLGLMKHYKTFRVRRGCIQKNKQIFKYGWISCNYLCFRPVNEY